MRFLTIGTGSIGRRHYKNIISLGYKDIAVVRSRRRMDVPQREFFKEYAPRTFYDIKRALAEKPDAVFICNPTSFHVPTARAALRAGAHVFIEKPISHTMAGVDALLADARKRRKIICVGYHFRYHPLLKIAKRLLDAGKLGRIHAARFVNGEYLPGWHPWEDYRKSYAGRRDLGGGVTLTQSHDLDVIYWFFGKPSMVSAVVKEGGALGIDVDDNAVISFSLPGGLVATAHLDYLSRPPAKYFEIRGSKGNLFWDYYTNELRFVRSDGKTRIVKSPPHFERNQMYVAELKDFLRCIRRGAPPASDGASAHAVLNMIVRAKEAGRGGRAIKV